VGNTRDPEWGIVVALDMLYNGKTGEPYGGPAGGMTSVEILVLESSKTVSGGILQKLTLGGEWRTTRSP